jgi:hypothetical protein
LLRIGILVATAFVIGLVAVSILSMTFDRAPTVQAPSTSEDDFKKLQQRQDATRPR